MLSLIKKLFGPSPAQATAPPSRTNQHFEPNPQMQAVEVANLCLAAILDRLPDELKPLVLKQPDASATVALPVATIVKQLPGGAVKVSLATLHRQAPAGVLGPLPPGDKRMVDVPLAEVFRHIKPTMFKRRNDQRAAAALDSKFNLFGDAQNPYQIAPTAPEDEVEPVEVPPAPSRLPKFEPSAAVRERTVPEFKLAHNPTPTPAPTPTPLPARGIAPPANFFEPAIRKLPEPPPSIVAAPIAAPVPPPTVASAVPPQERPSIIPEPTPVIVAAPMAEPLPPSTAAPAAPPNDRPSITVPVEPLCGGWPEPIRNALAILNGSARVALPAEDVKAGLARGKVTFTWGQIRTWLEPALDESSVADEATELTLPLKIVAPVFLAATKNPKVEQRPAEFDSEIPALFSDARAGTAEIAPALEVADESPVAETPSATEAAVAPEPTEASIAAEPPEAPLTFTFAPDPIEEPALAPAAEPAPAKEPATIGELFGQPDKPEWTPAEIVAHLAKLPSVSGAVVALQEGLLVAHSMPGDVKSDVIAAFLPQLFARLNQYAGEMKLGEVDDLLFTTHGAHCQIYRLGYVYFAVLGKPGEPLPWAELRLVADELARQTQKS